MGQNGNGKHPQAPAAEQGEFLIGLVPEQYIKSKGWAWQTARAIPAEENLVWVFAQTSELEELNAQLAEAQKDAPAHHKKPGIDLNDFPVYLNF